MSVFIQIAPGLAPALGKSELSIPKAIAKGMSIYLLSAIGFKGAASVTTLGIDGTLLKALSAGMLKLFGLPFIVFALLKTLTGMSRLDAAHYCSNSILTFVAATSLLEGRVSRKIKPHFDSNRHGGPKWRNNPIESDRAALKRLLRYRQSFQSFRSDEAILDGNETMLTFERSHIYHIRSGGFGVLSLMLFLLF